MPHSTSKVARHRRKKKFRRLAKGYRGGRKNYRQAREAVERAWKNAWFHRKRRKRDFRRLWIVRLSAAARLNGMTYSQLIFALKKAEIELNRKSLSELAIRDPKAFTAVVEKARSA